MARQKDLTHAAFADQPFQRVRPDLLGLVDLAAQPHDEQGRAQAATPASANRTSKPAKIRRK